MFWTAEWLIHHGSNSLISQYFGSRSWIQKSLHRGNSRGCCPTKSISEYTFKNFNLIIYLFIFLLFCRIQNNGVSPETIDRHWKNIVKELEDAKISTKFTLILIKIYNTKSIFRPAKSLTFSLEDLSTFSLENLSINFKNFVYDHNDASRYVYLRGYGTTKVYRTVQVFFMSGFMNLCFIQRPELSINVSVFKEKDYPEFVRSIMENKYTFN